MLRVATFYKCRDTDVCVCVCVCVCVIYIVSCPDYSRTEDSEQLSTRIGLHDASSDSTRLRTTDVSRAGIPSGYCLTRAPYIALVHQIARSNSKDASPDAVLVFAEVHERRAPGLRSMWRKSELFCEFERERDNCSSREESASDD